MQKRLPHIGVVRLELDEGSAEFVAAAAPVAEQSIVPRWKRAAPIAITATIVGALGAAAAIWIQTGRSHDQSRALRSCSRTGNPITSSRQFLTISPDGTRIAYEDNTRVYVRSLSDAEARPVPGTEDPRAAGLSNPVFSPDGESIVYTSGAERALKRIPVAGGAAITICPIDAPFGVSWDTARDPVRTARKGHLPRLPEWRHAGANHSDEKGRADARPTEAAGRRDGSIHIRGWQFRERRHDMGELADRRALAGDRPAEDARAGRHGGPVTSPAATSSTPFAACCSPCRSTLGVSR